MILTLSKITFNKDNKVHSNALETLKNHMAINLSGTTMKQLKIHFDLVKENYVNDYLSDKQSEEGDM